MQDRIIDAIVARILVALPEDETHSRVAVREAVTTAGVPASLMNFLDRSLERRTQLQIEDALEGPSAWFNSADPAVRGAMEHLQHEAVRAACFPADEWARAVRHSTETTLSYLIDPVHTLVSFIFAEGSDSALVFNARRRSGYFRDYSHITRAVGAFIDKKNDDHISRHELAGVLRHVDRNIVSEFNANAWMNHMGPLLTFVSFSGLISEGLPVSFASRFLEARGHTAGQEAVATAARKARADMISVPTLTSLLHALGQDEPTALDPATPLWRQFSKTPGERAEAGLPSPAESPEPLWRTFQESVTAHEPGLAELEREVVGAAAPNRARVVSELFAGNENLYRTVLSRLQAAPNWTAASRILANEVYRPHAVDIYSETAVTFTNAVESRYHPNANQS